MTGLLREEECPSSSAAIEALRFLPAEGVGLAALYELLLLGLEGGEDVSLFNSARRASLPSAADEGILTLWSVEGRSGACGWLLG